jgi:hypothetical protein
MQTAYQAGKGYLQKVLSPEEEAAEQAKMAAEEAPSAENDEIATDSDKSPEETPEETPDEQAGAEAGEDVSQNTHIAHQHDTHHDDTVSQANRSSLDYAEAKPAAIAEVEPVAPRPKRMKFNVKPTS